MTLGEKAVSQFKDLLSASSGAERSFRQEAWDEYARLGLPSRKTETWKYTSLRGVEASAWELSALDNAGPLPKSATEWIGAWAKEFSVVVTVNGVLRADLSSLDKKYLAPADFAVLRRRFDDGWSGLSAAMSRPGFLLNVPPGEVLNKPVLIVHVQTSERSWSPSVNVLRLGPGAQLELAEIHVGFDQTYLRSESTQVELGERALLNWVRVQQESQTANSFSEIQAALAGDAHLHLTQLHGGSAWCRSSLRAEILGERASAHLSGLTFARGHQHIDQRVEVRHAKGLSESTQLFKGVLKDHARGVLNGKILIERDAQKVSSMQLNHNLLLSPTAEADTKPELEIYADDVKANHGASIGRLNDDEMFYLMSRGIPRTLAQQMLAHAFVGDVLMKIGPKPLRRFADSCVQAWLLEFSAEMEHSLDGIRA